MSDLPSRDFFNGNDITMSGDWQLIDEAVSVLDAYASGRLVDRETIDYEAMARELLAAGAFRDRNILSAAAYEPLMRSMVLAALGVTDEK